MQWVIWHQIQFYKRIYDVGAFWPIAEWYKNIFLHLFGVMGALHWIQGSKVSANADIITLKPYVQLMKTISNEYMGINIKK